ncbi:penicillin-binding protein 1C [Aestuariivita boseongensis]|uniref:penicillin-binding protein 1C n=1 Tax=Aestuariivita boseongensis TaxID=1470562 RepID=UPI0006813180|nr:penicillin-binding protein 1C [Aestuariivita boseongensis]
MIRAAPLLFTAGLALAGLGALRDFGDAWIARTDLPPVLTETSVEVVDRTGTLMRVFPVEDGRWRLAVSVSDVDPLLIDMLIRYEDQRFWSHAGVDPLALIRAALQSAWHGEIVSGGSTLTMQLARLLENGSTGQWSGKLRQMRLALALERRLTKDQILSLYLLHAPYGGNLEGIRSATRAWFGKDPRRLTHAEAALLIALPQSPEARRPDRNPDTARAARDRVLARLAQDGVIAQDDTQVALRSAVPLRAHRFPALAPHLTDQVAVQDPVALRHHLTLDARLQARLERLLQEDMAQAPPRVSAALVVADHRTGEILASVGSPDFTDTQRQGFVDMTRAIRSPGSTLKPLVYGLAFDQGLVHPATLIHDGPVQFGRYAPQNFDGQFRGDIRVRDALQLSLNIPVIKLTHAMGPARVMSAISRAGVEARVPGGKPGLAISLGGIGLSLRDLVQLYAALASGGEAIPLSHLPQAEQPKTRLISRSAAWQIGHVLADLAPPPGAPAHAVAYKTGTSYGHRDAWAVGWDGRHVIGVWVGRPDGTPVPGAYGADAAAPILFKAFGSLKPAFDPLPPPPPETLLLGAAQLPQPLQRFSARQSGLQQANAPELTFPPDGASLSLSDAGLVVKLRGGQRPYAILSNGLPVAMNIHAQEVEMPNPGAGFSTLTVVDAQGQSARVNIRVLD